MKSTVTVARTPSLVIRKPPLFAIVCVVIWAASVWLACQSRIQLEAIDATSAITAP